MDHSLQIYSCKVRLFHRLETSGYPLTFIPPIAHLLNDYPGGTRRQVVRPRAVCLPFIHLFFFRRLRLIERAIRSGRYYVGSLRLRLSRVHIRALSSGVRRAMEAGAVCCGRRLTWSKQLGSGCMYLDVVMYWHVVGSVVVV